MGGLDRIDQRQNRRGPTAELVLSTSSGKWKSEKFVSRSLLRGPTPDAPGQREISRDTIYDVPQTTSLTVSTICEDGGTPRSKTDVRYTPGVVLLALDGRGGLQESTKCLKCAPSRVLLKIKTNLMKTFPASRSLEFVALYTLGLLTRTTTGFQYFLVIVDRLMKQTKVFLLRRIDEHMSR